MKRIPAFLLFCFVYQFSEAQLLKRLGDRAKQKVEQKAAEKVDKAIDNAVDGNGQQSSEGENASTTPSNASKPGSTGGGIKAYSKFDFVPGDIILYADDFSQDVVGEFPLKWNTNGSGEIVTIEGLQGKWLKMVEGTYYDAAYKKKLPENYTVEFDLLAEYKDNMRIPGVEFKIIGEKQANAPDVPQVVVRIEPNAGTNAPSSEDAMSFASYNAKGLRHLEGNRQLYGTFTALNHKTTPVHVAVWVQKQRIRVWVNEKKMYDLPKGISEDAVLDMIQFQLDQYGGDNENYGLYISNLKIAAASPDTRSKLITEGKWSTNGILFDVNSDKIKPVSYGVLKEIATTLKENPTVKVKIIGHTDSDGEDGKNKELSEKRAVSVRAALVAEFGLEASRFETTGMGESRPVADNKTPEGKAQNRRVEFIKL
jgi:outer membrane protein OmpA-like peptidoglycan-associated protein